MREVIEWTNYQLPPVRTIRLEGEDAAEFARRLFHPTKEETESHNAIIDDIDRTIHITETADGFMAEIEGLDLSFLAEEEEIEKSCA